MPEIPKRIIKTTQLQDESLKRRSSVLHILFLVTFGILALSALSIIIAYFTGFNRYVLHRLIGVTAAILVVVALYVCLKKRRYFIAASGLLIIYWLLATVPLLTPSMKTS